MSLQYDIREITTAETLPIRQRVLKPFLRPDECINVGDDLPTTYHFGLFHADKLVSVATFLLESHPDFSAGFPYRLRGMATDDKYRGQGFGQKLLRYGVEHLRSKRCDLLWFNARIKAFPFYEKLGFYYHGPLFEMKDIGPHKVMYKPLIPR
ncbi:GNAT family N-acetyltransferase [Bdellovibrio sp. HCB-162]|uniref:GNAT family N-acetyltransferase n=1 Tax=Bdellovibrio sp. HCB-162 TaxID=3394234 RepID=UPI0039BCA4D0